MVDLLEGLAAAGVKRSQVASGPGIGAERPSMAFAGCWQWYPPPTPSTHTQWAQRGHVRSVPSSLLALGLTPGTSATSVPDATSMSRAGRRRGRELSRAQRSISWPGML
ncbi:MAG: hypothetical protein KF878_11715 [Planctomycetes bacterium]|nr:hypothetical protein [Planctomycetota bacterium]